MHHLVAPLRQIPQHLELPMREMDRLLPAACAQRAEVDHEPSDQEPLERRMRAAQHGADPREQLLKVEGLRDVVVGAELQPLSLSAFWRAPTE